jgi:predicted transcriptional regulator
MCRLILAFVTPEFLVPDILMDDLLTLTAEIVSAHVSFHRLDADELALLIGGVHRALGTLGDNVAGAATAEERPRPAVDLSASVKPDHLVCLEDGLKLKTLKRHLARHHGLTPAEYRKRWGLSLDYPMVAPAYATRRREIALDVGLGRRPETTTADDAPAEVQDETAVIIAAEAKAKREPISELPPTAEAPSEPAQPKRRTLSAKFKAPEPSAEEEPLTPQALLCRAIATRSCVEAIYNKQHMVLAPHIVFTRHDEPFVRAVAVERDGKRPAMVKLGTFRLTGLVDLKATTKRFLPNAVFERDAPEYVGTTVCII